MSPESLQSVLDILDDSVLAERGQKLEAYLNTAPEQGGPQPPSGDETKTHVFRDLVKKC